MNRRERQKEQIAEIKIRQGFREMRKGMFPDWMEGTKAYMDKMDQIDNEWIHYIRCGGVLK